MQGALLQFLQKSMRESSKDEAARYGVGSLDVHVVQAQITAVVTSLNLEHSQLLNGQPQS